ncbi:LysR family transcriptional regulator [Ancylobacter dichloromethanicus]|uniref:Transcriptional regulator n=1 Tax=Ancylobacter dichloromethanicus TaxID=518825 RepID=A0A9W6JF80_9HYPH|nr:LysR family transcriptional regulator [Ancylobacter dichloromethanicus]MBS7553127.1 LysR family transcriptional regulator [Ancylobacter dichloromethanicus]GLK74644.1 transcriptional regulator [Ancylobacter dichloromethanicus]
MNFAQLRAFQAIATHRTFSEAAQALGVSQPAITQHVKALEEAVGARLFLRTGAGIELTPDGRDLLPRVRQVMLMLDDIGARMDEGRTLNAGYLALGLCAPYVAMPILERFTALHPGIRLDVRLANSSVLLDLVAQQRVDIAIATLETPHPDFACDRLLSQEVLVLVYETHPWWGRDKVAVRELADQRFVLREAGSMTRHLFEAALSRHGIALAPHLVLGSREAVKEAVAARIGLGIVLNRELGCDPRLHAVAIEGAPARADEYLVTRRETRQLGAVAAFAAVAASGFGIVA